MRSRAILAALVVTALIVLPVLTPVQAQTGSRKVFQIVATSYKYTPALLTVNTGDTVVIQFRNEDTDGRAHSIAARLFVDIQVTARGDYRTGVADGRRFFAAEPGEGFELEFVAGVAGSFPFVCGIFDHGARGQTGAINVIAGQ